MVAHLQPKCKVEDPWLPFMPQKLCRNSPVAGCMRGSPKLTCGLRAQERAGAARRSADLALLWAHPRLALLPALAGFLACAALVGALRLAGTAEL